MTGQCAWETASETGIVTAEVRTPTGGSLVSPLGPQLCFVCFLQKCNEPKCSSQLMTSSGHEVHDKL